MKIRGLPVSRPHRARPGWGAGSGFSLIEVLVAILVFSIGGLAAAQMQIASTKANQAAANRQIASNLARQLLEAVEPASYTHAGLASTGGSFVNPHAAFSPPNPLNAQGEAPVGGPGRFFTRDWRIDATGASGETTANFKTIRVRVTWNQGGQQQQIEIRTIKGWTL